MKTKYEYPEGKAVKGWTKDNVGFSIIHVEGSGYQPRGWYCGYCRFPSRPTIEEGYSGILNYVPVHGGITYAGKGEDATMVYGFDCAHSGDETREELFDLDWLSSECERMAQAIEEAASIEPRYLVAPTNEEKAEIIDAYHKELEAKGIVFVLTDNFGAMINVMFGGL